MARSWRFARNAVRVRDTGVRRMARVTEHRAPLMGNEKKPETRLVWKDGAGQEAVSLTLSEADARRFPVGCEIATYELPEAGLPSVWEGDVGGDGGAEAD
jgi:hypothetical protein